MFEYTVFMVGSGVSVLMLFAISVRGCGCGRKWYYVLVLVGFLFGTGLITDLLWWGYAGRPCLEFCFL